MTLRQFQIHKNEWWANTRTRLEALRYIFENSSYKTYSMTNRQLFEKYVWYLKQLVDPKLFPIKVDDLNIYNPDEFADVQTVCASLMPIVLGAIQQIQTEVQKLETNISWIEKSLGDKINFLKFIEYKINWENNFHYCRFEIFGNTPFVFEKLLSSSFNHEVIDGKRILTVFIEPNNWP